MIEFGYLVRVEIKRKDYYLSINMHVLRFWSILSLFLAFNCLVRKDVHV
jgi:hypothetical protein